MKKEDQIRKDKLQRLEFAARSKPAEKRPPGAPSGLACGTHSRGYLPHVKVPGASYFVTFRLADSLPKSVLEKLVVEAEREAADGKVSGKECKPEEFLSDKIQTYLDAGSGACWLRNDEVAALVSDAIRFFEGQRYHLHAWVVMPNHAHAVLRPVASFTLSEILHSWKSFTAKKVNQFLRKSEPEFWQAESYDRWCRDEAEVAHWVRYTVMNPVNAGLCERPEDWRWSSAWGRLVAG